MNKVFLAGAVHQPAVTETFNNFTKTTLVIECKEYFNKNGCVDYKLNLVPVEFFGNNQKMAEGLKKNDFITVQGRVAVRSYKSKTGSDITIMSITGEYVEIINKSHDTKQSQQNEIVDDNIPF